MKNERDRNDEGNRAIVRRAMLRQTLSNSDSKPRASALAKISAGAERASGPREKTSHASTVPWCKIENRLKVRGDLPLVDDRANRDLSPVAAPHFRIFFRSAQGIQSASFYIA